MKKDLIKVFCIGLVLIMCVGILCACNKNDDDFRNPRNGEPEAGEFYTLQEAYGNGWLSKGDLRNIAYYYNNSNIDYPTGLEDGLENAIKQSYCFDLQKSIPNAEIAGVHINKFYGIYDNFVAVTMSNDYVSLDLIIEKEYEIGGIKFYNYDYQITIYAK